MTLRWCHNYPRDRKPMRVQDGWRDDGDTRYPVMVDVPDRFTEPCHYSRGRHEKGMVDPACGDCVWKHKDAQGEIS